MLRKENKKERALVKWKGYTNDFNSWVPIEDLEDFLLRQVVSISVTRDSVFMYVPLVIKARQRYLVYLITT